MGKEQDKSKPSPPAGTCSVITSHPVSSTKPRTAHSTSAPPGAQSPSSGSRAGTALPTPALQAQMSAQVHKTSGKWFCCAKCWTTQNDLLLQSIGGSFKGQFSSGTVLNSRHLHLWAVLKCNPHCTEEQFSSLTSESPQRIPSSGGWLSWQLPAQGPHGRPGLPTPITAFNKLSFSFSGVSITLPSLLAQACAPPRGNGHCSTALPSWPSGPVLQPHTEGFSR